MSEEAGHLADLPACPTARTAAEVGRGGAQRGPPSGSKTFRYALTVVDVASRYKEAEPLTSKTAAEVVDGLARIYKRSLLRWPKLLQIDPGREFMGAVTQLLAKHGVEVRRGRVDIHLLGSSWPPCWSQGAKAPFRCWCSLSVPTWRARGRSSPRD